MKTDKASSKKDSLLSNKVLQISIIGVLALAVMTFAGFSIFASGAAGEDPENPGTYSDVPDTHFAAEHLKELAQLGVLTTATDCDDQNFCPNEEVDRKTVAAWLAKTAPLNYDPDSVIDIPDAGFEDVERTGPWFRSVNIIADHNITNGCSQEPLRFCPEGTVSRKHMALFINRAFLTLPADQRAGFTDIATQSDEVKEAIEALYINNITTGCSQDPLRFCPDNNITRAEAATMINRARRILPVADENEDPSNLPGNEEANNNNNQEEPEGVDDPVILPANWDSLSQTEKIALNPYGCLDTTHIRADNGQCFSGASTSSPVTEEVDDPVILPANWDSLSQAEKIALNPYGCLDTTHIRADNGQCFSGSNTSTDDDTDTPPVENGIIGSMWSELCVNHDDTYKEGIYLGPLGPEAECLQNDTRTPFGSNVAVVVNSYVAEQDNASNSFSYDLVASTNRNTVSWRSFGPKSTSDCNEATFNLPPAERNRVGSSNTVSISEQTDLNKYYCFEATGIDGFKTYGIGGFFGGGPTQLKL